MGIALNQFCAQGLGYSGLAAQPLARNTDGTTPFNPSQISSLVAWYDASDPLATGVPPADNTALGTWYDKKGTNHLLQATGANQPAYRNNTGVNRVVFDGTTDFMTWTSEFSLTTGTVFIVFKPLVDVVAASGGRVFIARSITTTQPQVVLGAYTGAFANETLTFGVRNAPNYLMSMSVTPITNSVNHQFSCDSNNYFRYDRTSPTIQTTGGGWAGGGSFGICGYFCAQNGPGQRFQGDMCDVYLFSQALTPTEYTDMETYLAAKWATA